RCPLSYAQSAPCAAPTICRPGIRSAAKGTAFRLSPDPWAPALEAYLSDRHLLIAQKGMAPIFLAPPLPPEVKRRGMLFRVLSTVGLLTTAFLLVVANVILWLACYFAIDPKVTPQQLYHNTWQAVKDNVYDQSKLANWDDWEHKYDGQIKT